MHPFGLFLCNGYLDFAIFIRRIAHSGITSSSNGDVSRDRLDFRSTMDQRWSRPNLYKRKSGEELKTQLFRFVDQGDRDVCLRPEMTPTLARLVAARAREYKKPIKWFSISPFFRFEKPQKGRLREFYQINCDILGDNSPAADAELIGLAVALHQVFGLTDADFFVRVNNRRLWAEFLTARQQPIDRLSEFLSIIDKLERESEEITARKLQSFQLDLTAVREFMRTPAASVPGFSELFRELQWRGLDKYVELDLTIVRGLDYYTGLVFEIFDRKKAESLTRRRRPIR